jgi:hypothetical protein
MVGKIIQVGDKVAVNIPDENWDGGYRPVEHQWGTVATVKGFGEIHYTRIENYGREPGVYVNHSWVELEGIDGQISSCFLEPLVDEDEYKRRVEAFRKDPDAPTKVRLRDLPEMALWEGDIVEMPEGNPWNDEPRLKVARINYEYLGWMRTDGVTPMPEYTVEPEGGNAGTVAVNASELKLVERGNVWKYFNGKKPVFASLNEEAQFFVMIGRCIEVRNPVSQLFSWTLEEVVQGAKDGIVDCMACDYGIFNMSKGIIHRAQRFHDRGLGERVRAMFLKEFENHLMLVQ